MADSGDKRPLGFDALAQDEEEGAGYTVKFSSTEHDSPEPVPQAPVEEINLLETGSDKRVEIDAEKKIKEQTVYFEDGVTKIDFILTYKEEEPDEGEEPKKGMLDKLTACCCPKRAKTVKLTKTKAEKRKIKREKFLDSCRKLGLTFEIQHCDESPDGKTWFVKVHGKHDALLKGAEEMLLRMPIRENNLYKSGWRERFFDWIKVRDPFEPIVPQHLEIENYFTAPFDYERRDNYLHWNDEKKFFTSAQRSAIVWHHLQNARYGDQEDQIGILRLRQNGCFTDAFPLHDSSHKVKDEDEKAKMSDRQFLFHEWSHPKNWYKKQPLDHIRHYFGEKIGIYFTWLGFYTTWLLPASIIGIIIFIYGLTTVVNPVATDICNQNFRYNFYMCPRCDGRCDFWYLRDSCSFSRLAQVFDNVGTVVFAIIMSFWAVLFLEFWKRRQFFLQYDWDMLGYEDAEERARPQFEQKIKRAIRKRGNTEAAKKKFTIYNPVLEKEEYIQPTWWLWPKVVTTMVILISMIAVVLGVVVSVVLFRLWFGSWIYARVNGLFLGPTIGDIVVSIVGACLQLVAIIVLNRVYSLLAYQLTNWELHRTQTEYEDSFTFKMYLFQFFNFYSSLFYIGFFKGNLSGNPGEYERYGGLRVDECATYGCMFELTIQLIIIMLGKQLLNNVQELSLPYVKRIYNLVIRNRKQTDEDIYARWEKDYDLIALDKHGLFSEYLELVIQYGFITIFVVAFPLAPLFALLNNWIEIRLDAHKFTSVLRRPVAERAQDIGAWYSILATISEIAVIVNALLIAFTAQLIPVELYAYNYADMDFLRSSDARTSGYVDWSLSEFRLENLIDGRAFPGFSSHQLQLYDSTGTLLKNGNEDVLYLPFIDFQCLLDANIGLDPAIFVNVTDPRNGGSLITVDEATYQSLTFDSTNTTLRDMIYDLTVRPSPTNENSVEAGLFGPCFIQNVTCRYRGFVEDGYNTTSRMSNSIRGVPYWQVLTVRLAFVLIFENFIRIVAAFIAYIIPDVPQSVKNEIQREKLLAYEAIHARQDEAEAEEAEGGGGGEGEGRSHL